MKPELLNDVGQAMVDAAPDGWTRLTLDITGAGNLIRGKLAASMADGSVNTKVALDRAGAKACRLLREDSHREGTGAWYNAHVEIDQNLHIIADFDYDNPPLGGLTDQGGQANDDVLRTDQQLYPRSPEHLPAWHPAKATASE